MKKNILITAIPGIGKSTVLVKVVEGNPGAIGILTTEVLENGSRVGFRMVYDSNNSEVIAHIDFDSGIKVSKYKVKTSAMSHCITRARSAFTMLATKDSLLYLDEIGQMQLYSEEFRELVTRYFDSSNTCVATLSAVFEDDFTRAIRKRDDILLIEVTPENRETLPEFINLLVGKIEKAKKYTQQFSLFVNVGSHIEFVSESGFMRKINLVEKTCTCDFYKKYEQFHVCSHILAAQEVFKK